VCSHQRRMAGAGVMEVVMSKAPMRNYQVSPDVHELGDGELDRVVYDAHPSGGARSADAPPCSLISQNVGDERHGDRS
jgi:hypothetical protein